MSSQRAAMLAPNLFPAPEGPAEVAQPAALSLAVPEQREAPTPPSATHELSPAARDVLGFDARLLTDLPLATTLVCRRKLGDGQLVVTTSRAVWEAAKRVKVPVFAGGELWSMVLAAEHDRASPVALEAWCRTKADQPNWRLTVDVALGEVVGDFPPLGWTVGMALRGYGAALVEVCCGDELPALLRGHTREAS